MYWWVRVTYINLLLYFCPPIQEEGGGGMVAILSSQVEGGRSILQQGHTDRQTRIRTARQTGHIYMYA